MSIRVGPFIGVSDNEARIWFDAEPDTEYIVKIRHPSGQVDEQRIRTFHNGLGMAKYKGLTANTNYLYSIKSAGNRVLEGVEDHSFTTFPKRGEDVDLKFVFFSCNRPFLKVRRWLGKKKAPSWAKISFVTQARRELVPESLLMWKELGKMIHSPSQDSQSPNAPRFLLGIGDQIYVEELWTKKQLISEAANAGHQDLVFAYSQLYRKCLGIQEIREVTACYPFFMMWDDHEILDGWGSHGNEHEPPQQKIFQAASEAYGQYQLMHNPYVDPQRGYYAFIYGKIGFIVLDLRRYRSKRNGILFGKEQWDWLEDWLKNQGKQCEVIIIACSVPFIHLTNHIMRIGKQWLGKFLVKIFDIEDDLVDQWGSAPFIKDAQRFAELLFDLANNEGIRFVLLGGDVHVATFAVLRSYEQKHEYHPVIYQFTSSPISNKPAKVAKALMTIAPEIELSPNIPFKGRLLKVIAKRNFGIVEIQKHRTTGDYSITFELRYQDDKSVKIERFSTQW